MGAIFWWFVVSAACVGGMSKLFKLTGFQFQNETEEIVFSAAFGLGLLAYFVFILGSLGLLQKPFAAVLIFAFFGFSLRTTSRILRTVFGKILVLLPGLKGWEAALLLIFIGVSFFFVLTGAIAPPIGKDELCYHLMQPKFYVKADMVYEVPYSINSLWPYLMEMLFTLGLLLQGAALAKLFHFSFYLLTGVAIYAFVRRFADRKTAWTASAIYWLTPAAFVQGAFAYVDNALACYVFLAVYALIIYWKTSKLRWAVLSGLAAGFAASTKLLGLFALPLVLVFLIVR